MLMKKVLVFIQAKEEHPELTKPQLCKIIRILDSSDKYYEGSKYEQFLFMSNNGCGFKFGKNFPLKNTT